MHRDLFSSFYDPPDNPSCCWAQRSLLDGLDLLHSDIFGLDEHSERDRVTRIWNTMLTVHNYSEICARE
jgi:hypothetical protein